MGLPDTKFNHYTFNSGENKGEPPTFASSSELDRSWNIENRGNGLVPRYGGLPFNVDVNNIPVPIAGNDPVLSTFPHTYNGVYDSFFTSGTSIYRDRVNPVNVKTGLTANLRFQGQRAGNIFYITNGDDPVFYFDPDRSTTQLYEAGYDVPATFLAADFAAGAMPAGTYEYYVTWYDENTYTESLKQTVPVSVVVGANRQVQLTNLPIDPENRTTYWYIYRKDPTGFFFYFLDRAPYTPGTPTYNDNEPSTGIGTIAPTDNDRPDPSAVICLHDNIMVYAQGNALTWSKTFRFQNVPTYNRELLNDTSEAITKMISFRGTLVIWKTDSIYRIQGNLNGDYDIKKISSTTGTESPDTVVEGPDGIYFLDNKRTPRYINSTDFYADDIRESSDISYKYRRKFNQISTSAIQNAHAVLIDTAEVNQYRIFVPIGTTYPTFCFAYDIGLAASNGGDSSWFCMEYKINCVSSAAMPLSSGVTALQVGDDYGIIWKLQEIDHFYDGYDYFTRYEDGPKLSFAANTVTVARLMDLNTVVGTFVVGETITGGTSGDTGVISAVHILLGAGYLEITGVTGPFTAGETITGGTSGATALLDDAIELLTINQFLGSKLSIFLPFSYDEAYVSRITANGYDNFTVEQAIPADILNDVAPNYYISVGGYLAYFATSNYAHDHAGRCRPFAASVLFNAQYSGANVQFFTHYDFNQAFNYTYNYINNPVLPSLTPQADNYTLLLDTGQATYDSPSSLYDLSRYALVEYGTDDFLLNSKYLFNHVSWGIISREPNNPFGYIGATFYYQFKGRTSSRH